MYASKPRCTLFLSQAAALGMEMGWSINQKMKGMRGGVQHFLDEPRRFCKANELKDFQTN